MQHDMAMPVQERAQAGEVILEVRGVTVAFGDKTILENLDMDVRRGEILGFVGASGAGKSVLLRTILGLTPKKSGTIRLFGRDLDHVPEEEQFLIDRSEEHTSELQSR